VDTRLGEIETALAAFEDRPRSYDPAEVARAGVFVSIGSDGRLSVDRGYVRPKDEPPATTETDGERESGDETDDRGEPARLRSSARSSQSAGNPSPRRARTTSSNSSPIDFSAN
jgi:ParB family transcriptional regulator, chromosome partitioning protein